MTEKRHYTRANYMFGLLFFIDEKQDVLYSTNSKNISQGGCYLIFNREIPAGTVLHIGVDLSNSRIGAETVKSEIRRCEKIMDNIYGLGAEFKNLSTQMKQALADFVEKTAGQKPLPEVTHYLRDTRSWHLDSTH